MKFSSIRLLIRLYEKNTALVLAVLQKTTFHIPYLSTTCLIFSQSQPFYELTFKQPKILIHQ